ncbi:Pectic acid lyase [Planctomycetes bacterium CA13]|uniref:Pectic acid lyase n=1 Tax=Novipirellula herctigrandis TaxID=2527986 RepID=A0A5C5Z0F1_9BACT|nr:Pectic acid lyase [Planctomycetes bacterium CA13]
MRQTSYVAATCAASLLLCASIGVSYDLGPNSDTAISESVVTSAIRKAVVFYRGQVASHGGYVYYYSTDMSQRWGEGMATADQIWVQPPATPTVGMAYLKAYEAIGDSDCLDAAQDAAEALVYGQRRSGGWSNSIDLKGRKLGFQYEGGTRRKDGISSLDDGQTQAAIQLLVLVDEALEFKNDEIHESATTALDTLLSAQFPGGGFPQVWKEPVAKQPVLKASFPKYEWRTDGRIKNYWDMYTLNDNVCGHVAGALITAHRVYQDDRYITALKRLGDFLVLAQMPEPQPAWAQQYNYDMHPIWARKFEPPAIAGDESQEVIETLMKISIATGDRKYLEPIPRALAYLKRSLLPDGRLARYYELTTNRPLYMVRQDKSTYALTYDDSNLPSHYRWKWDSKVTELERRLHAVKTGQQARSKTKGELQSKVSRIVQELDEQGRWLSTYVGQPLVGQPKFPPDAKFLSSEVFSRNITILSDYLEVSKK